MQSVKSSAVLVLEYKNRVCSKTRLREMPQWVPLSIRECNVQLTPAKITRRIAAGTCGELTKRRSYSRAREKLELLTENTTANEQSFIAA
jgi:hypothetical protein